MLKKYGRPVVVCTGKKEWSTNVLIQPLRYKNKMYLDFERSEIGIKDNTCFLYIGPADVELKETETIIMGEDCSYSVSRADVIYLGRNPIYIWAVLTKRIKDGQYEYL